MFYDCNLDITWTWNVQVGKVLISYYPNHNFEFTSYSGQIQYLVFSFPPQAPRI